VLNNKLYCFGGWGQAANRVQIGTLYRDMAGNPAMSWTLGRPVPFDGGSGIAAAYTDTNQVTVAGLVSSRTPHAHHTRDP